MFLHENLCRNLNMVLFYREFVGCVRCIRILSPCEVKQMGEEGMQLLNSAAAMQQDLVPKD